MPDRVRFILASGSPRRSQLLREVGLRFTVEVPDVDEEMRNGESAEALVERLARDKADTVARRIQGDAQILAADTVVVLDERVIGKPVDTGDAVAMLLRLSNRTHSVLTGYALQPTRGDDLLSGVEASQVTFRSIERAEAEAYVATGEPMDKAGAYAAQGEGVRFIQRITGLRSNVIGLPVETLLPLLAVRGVKPE